MPYQALIADDEEYVRKSVEQRIKLSGCPVETAGLARSGIEALALFEQLQPDVVFVDIHMPGLDGLCFIERVRQLHPACLSKFIVISGYDEFDYLQRSIRLGVMNYIRKPIHQEEFEQALRSVCGTLDAQREERDRLGRRNLFHYYDDYIEELRNTGGEIFSGVLLLACGPAGQLLSENPKLDEFRRRAPQLMPFPEPEWIAFRRAPRIVAVLWRDAAMPRDRIEEAAKLLSLCANGPVACAQLREEELSRAMGQVEDTLHLRFCGDGRRVLPRVLKSVALPPAQDMLEVSLERGQEELFGTLLSRQADLWFGSRENLLSLSSAWRQVILLLLERFAREGLATPESMKEELLLFALEKYDCRAQIVERLSSYAAALCRTVRERNSESELVEQVSRYLEEHYMDNLSLNDLAEHFFVAYTYLSKRFREKKGVPLTQYLEELRLSRAADYLSHSDMPVAQVAEAVGYCDANYFTRVFHKAFASSPTDYRRKGDGA